VLVLVPRQSMALSFHEIPPRRQRVPCLGRGFLAGYWEKEYLTVQAKFDEMWHNWCHLGILACASPPLGELKSLCLLKANCNRFRWVSVYSSRDQCNSCDILVNMHRTSRYSQSANPFRSVITWPTPLHSTSLMYMSNRPFPQTRTQRARNRPSNASDYSEP
jgi:hypothetical protein